MQLLLPKTDQKSHRPCLLSAWVPREGGGWGGKPGNREHIYRAAEGRNQVALSLVPQVLLGLMLCYITETLLTCLLPCSPANRGQ